MRLTYRPEEHPIVSGTGLLQEGGGGRGGCEVIGPRPHTESGFEMPLGWVSWVRGVVCGSV